MDDTATDTNPATASRCRRNGLRFLRQLATKRSILPPSLFLHNLKRECSNGVRRAVRDGTFVVSFVSSVLRGGFSWVSMSGHLQGSHSWYSFLFPCLAYVYHSRDTRRTRKAIQSNFLDGWSLFNTSAQNVFRNFVQRSLFGNNLSTQISSLS